MDQLIWLTAPLCAAGEQDEDDGDGDRDEADVELEDQRQHGDHDQPDEGEDLLERDRLGPIRVLRVVVAATAARRGRRGPCRGPLGRRCRAREHSRVLDLLRDRHLAPDQLATAEHEEQDQRDGEVEEEAAQEDRHRAVGQALVGDDRVDRDAVDADGGETAALGAVDHHHAHQQRVDLVPGGEGQRDRRDDRDRGGESAPIAVSSAVTPNMIQGIAATWPPTIRTAPRTSRSTVPLFCAMANR